MKRMLRKMLGSMATGSGILRVVFTSQHLCGKPEENYENHRSMSQKKDLNMEPIRYEVELWTNQPTLNVLLSNFISIQTYS
jgi:hypothetical protein